jgi:beta-galactosidase
VSSSVTAKKRIKKCIDFNWKFYRGDSPWGWSPTKNDYEWKNINLPHDWSIEGPFSETNASGYRGGYAPTGIGWYRKYFKIPEYYRGKKVFIQFDGVYMNSEVWLNGVYLGKHPYGYTSFYYDSTPWLNYGDEENIIAVKVDNSNQPNSRWYSGSGIYRHVWLIITHKLHIEHWGTFVSTPLITEDSATIRIETSIKNEDRELANCNLITTIVDEDNNIVIEVRDRKQISGGCRKKFVQYCKIQEPKLWSIENPYLYKIYSQVELNGKLVDNYQTPLGIRKFHFEPDSGFFLNDKHVKIKGACIHHDCGPLGAACSDRAKERKIQIMKEMGCNAIRTAHNPPSPELLDYCDRYGLLVMDEAFDEWKVGKTWATDYGYRDIFDEWAERDLRSIIRRDRNHPSVFLWSVGNEIPMVSRVESVDILKRFKRIINEEDPTRPVTAGINLIKCANKTGFFDHLDVTGYNYYRELYDTDHKKYPNRKIVGSENRHDRVTRGIYQTQCRNYYSNYGTDGEEAWKDVRDRKFIAGYFIWTGIDYLGEHVRKWPGRNSNRGVVDLCGFPKDHYYLYQSQWKEEPVVHIFPHWNWEDRVGENIPVWCYTNCDSVELFLNGKSLGVRDPSKTSQLHLSWEVPYIPGTLKAVGFKEEETIGTHKVYTAGDPYKVVLIPDRKIINADGKDLSYVEVRIVDSEGNLIPNADNLVEFNIDGEGKIIGVGNGNPISHEDFKAKKRKAFNGLCLVIIQSNQKPGEITLTANSKDLNSDTIQIITVNQ